MRKVAIESPLGGAFAASLRYARLCALDCIRRNENPYASHLFFTQFLDDATPEERELGIKAGLEWAALADCRVVYMDLGVSDGMRLGIEAARALGQAVELRSLSPELMAVFQRGESAQGTEGIEP